MVAPTASNGSKSSTPTTARKLTARPGTAVNLVELKTSTCLPRYSSSSTASTPVRSGSRGILWPKAGTINRTPRNHHHRQHHHTPPSISSLAPIIIPHLTTIRIRTRIRIRASHPPYPSSSLSRISRRYLEARPSSDSHDNDRRFHLAMYQ